MPHVQRGFWNGLPDRFPEAITLRKQKGERMRSAVCAVWSQPFGWELRLLIGGEELRMSSVVRSVTEIMETAEKWKAAMLEEGWR
jgi:hypothetical protein